MPFIVACLFISLASWALSSPPGSDPDGSFHLASIYCGSGFKANRCEPPNPESVAARPKVVKVPIGVSLANACVPGNPIFAASCYPEYLENYEMTETAYNNAGRLYPNGYYWFSSKFVVKEIARTALTVRIVNIVLFIFLLLAIFWVCKPSLQRAVYFSCLLMLLPLGLFLVSSNNGSSWSIIGLSTYWAFLYTWLTADAGWQRNFAGALLVVSGAMASQSRADAALYVLLCTIMVIALVFVRREATLRKISYRALLPAIVGALAVMSFVQTGQKRAISQGLLGPLDTGRDPFETLLQNIMRIPAYFAGVFGGGAGAGGGLGWLDVQPPEAVVVLMTLMFGGLLFLSRGHRSKGEILTLSLLTLTVIAIPLANLQMDLSYVGENVQTRYVLPLVVVTVGMYLSGVETSLLQQFGRSRLGIFVGGLIIAYLLSMHQTIRRYTTGTDLLGWDLNTPREWWWSTGPLPMTVLYMGTAAFAIVASFVLFKADEDDSPLSSDE